MPPIFADSYGGLQQGISNDRAVRENDLRQALQMVIQRNQEMQRRRELRDSIMLHQQQQDIANRMAQQTFAEQVRQFNVGNQTHQDDLNFRRQAMTQKADVMPASVQTANLKVYHDAALSGNLPDLKPTHIDDSTWDALKQLDAQTKSDIIDQMKTARSASHVENTRQRLGREMTQSQQTVKDIPWWRKAWSAMVPFYQDPGYTYEEQRQSKLRDRIESLPQPLPVQELNAYTRIDPATGMRVPAQVDPPWMSRRMVNMNPRILTGTNGVPSGPVIDVPSTVQTRELNAPNPYAPGKRYGNLRYLGGDPNLETSWQPVQ